MILNLMKIELKTNLWQNWFNARRKPMTKNISYWKSAWHKFLVLLGIHVWGNWSDITPSFWRATRLRATLEERHCQNCTLRQERIR